MVDSKEEGSYARYVRVGMRLRDAVDDEFGGSALAALSRLVEVEPEAVDEWSC
ncbi:hypothetical protein M407DRAFT_246567 [Tulasnella calospora MUT 4182]|uniref:Uncharacterized protein n=1 Tax=Tulasnella calospora MUT 4182 TaxID=1051891 RepID=A0A0C3Q4E2_9AGAM|nr:hypothetical protein M407DRAFT_246567 [Tulasnella calospora MUT 4182]